MRRIQGSNSDSSTQQHTENNIDNLKESGVDQPSTSNSNSSQSETTIFIVNEFAKDILAKPIQDSTPEEAEIALRNGAFFRVENAESGSPVFKGTARVIKQIKSIGLSGVKIQGANGKTMNVVSTTFQELTDKETEELKRQIRTHIAFLRSCEPAKKENKEKIDREIKHLEKVLKHIEAETALRSNDPRAFERLHSNDIATIKTIKALLSRFRALQEAIQKERNEETDKKLSTIKAIVLQKSLKEDEIKEEVLFTSIIAQAILKAGRIKEERSREKINGDNLKEDQANTMNNSTESSITTDFVTINSSFNQTSRRIFTNLGSLLIRYQSLCA